MLPRSIAEFLPVYFWLYLLVLDYLFQKLFTEPSNSECDPPFSLLPQYLLSSSVISTATQKLLLNYKFTDTKDFGD